MRTIKVMGKDVPRDALLAALHNNTKAIGLGKLAARPNITRDEARKFIEQRDEIAGKPSDFTWDYFLGRPLKVEEEKGEITKWYLYDRDAGEGAFARAVEEALAMK